jgi:hypothetical protein
MTDFVKATYHEMAVTFSEDGWFNATAVAERFGKRPNDWLTLPATKNYIKALERRYGKIPYVKTRRGGNNKTNTRNSGNGGTWLHPKLGIPFARWLDDDFAVWCDEQIEGLLKGTHTHYDWKRVRHEATSSYKVMNAVLQLQRQMQGKPVAPHHFSNEARLINWALTGEFKGLDREALGAGELDLLARLEERNTVLMGCGLGYDDRKKALERFAADWRMVHPPAVLDAA